MISVSDHYPVGLGKDTASLPAGLFASKRWYNVAHTLGVRHSFVIDNDQDVVWPVISFADVISTSYRTAVTNALMTASQSGLFKPPTVAGSWNSNHVPLSGEEDLPLLLNTLKRTTSDVIVVPFLPLSKCRRVAAEVSGAMVVRCVPYSMLIVDWTSMDGYLKMLSTNGRHAVRADLRRQHAAGQIVTVELASTLIKEVSAIISPQDTSRQEVFIVALIKEFGDHVIVFVARDEKGVRGACLSLVFEGQLYLRNYGCRPDAKKDSHTYFACVFHEPIRYSIRNNFTRIHAGIGSEEAKRRRGFQVLEQVTVVLNRGSNANRPIGSQLAPSYEIGN